MAHFVLFQVHSLRISPLLHGFVPPIDPHLSRVHEDDWKILEVTIVTIEH